MANVFIAIHFVMRGLGYLPLHFIAYRPFQFLTHLFPKLTLVKAANPGRSTEITPTQPSTASTGIIIVEGNATTNISLNTTVNTTQPMTTRPTKEMKKTVPNIPSQQDGPKTQNEIPVFDPAKSVDLDVISGTTSGRRSPAVGFLIWICIVSVISN